MRFTGDSSAERRSRRPTTPAGPVAHRSCPARRSRGRPPSALRWPGRGRRGRRLRRPDWRQRCEWSGVAPARGRRRGRGRSRLGRRRRRRRPARSRWAARVPARLGRGRWRRHSDRWGGGRGLGAGDGSLGAGGAGAQAPPSQAGVIDGSPFLISGGQGGGGGGGGLFGGGGGASSAFLFVFGIQHPGASAGGGGGSSLVSGDGVLCTPEVETGVSVGDGSVAISHHRGASPRHLCPSDD